MARKTATENTAPASSIDDNAPEPASSPRPTRRPRQQTRQTTRRKTEKSGTAAVVEALLKSRGAKGANQDDLQRIVSWAQQVQAEGEAIEQVSVPRRAPRGTGQASSRVRAAAQRQRQQQEEALQERRRRYEMDRALLEGVVGGRITLDVQSEKIIFLSADLTPTLAAVPTQVEEAAVSEA